MKQTTFVLLSFAELSGLDEGVVRGMVEKGYIPSVPSVKIGRHRLVNLP